MYPNGTLKIVDTSFKTYVVIKISKTAIPGKLPINAMDTNNAVSMIELIIVLPYALIMKVLSELNSF